MAADAQDYVYMLDNDLGDTLASRLVVDGQSRLLDLDHPCVTRLNCGSMRGAGVQFYNENGEVESGVQVKDYHYFLDENNKIRPIPPGSILQGMFSVEAAKNSQAPVSASSSAQQLSENDVEETIDTSETTQSTTPSESFISSETKLEETEASGSGYYENLALSQGMDIELEEEIISCDNFPQKKVAPKPAKTPATRKIRKKKKAHDTIGVLNNQLDQSVDASQLNSTLNQFTGKVCSTTNNFNTAS